MKSKVKFLDILLIIIIIIAQYVLAIICVILFPGLGIPFLTLAPPSNPIVAHLSLLAAYTLGIFLAGWLGLILLRRKVQRQLSFRFVLTVLTISIPLAIATIPGIESDDILYFIAILAGILAFYVPEMIKKSASH